MAATAAATALYLLLAPVPGQDATVTAPNMEQLAAPMAQDACTAAAAHNALPGVGCYTQDSAEAGRVTADITPVAHHASAPMALPGK